MANMRLKKEIMQVVDNQLDANDPPCTKRTFFQLQKQGRSVIEAKEMIASVVVEEIYDILNNQERFDEKRYEEKLNELINGDIIIDKATQIVKDQKVYPNEPCPCGSGKKYKKCCGRN